MGKTPCEEDKLASLDMRSEKTPELDLRSEVGMKSRGEDFAGMEFRIGRTCSGEAGDWVGPTRARSGGGVESVGSLPMIVLWMDTILDLK